MKGNVVGQGGIPRQGDNVALANSVVGTTLKLRPPKGLYDGIDDNVTITDADFIADNIKNLVNIFGLTGTLIPRQMATGTVVASATGGNWKDSQNNTIDATPIVVSGLSFQPDIIFAYETASPGYSVVYFSNANFDFGTYAVPILSNVSVGWKGIRMVSPAVISASGFTLPVRTARAGQSFTWLAVKYT